MTEYAAAAGLPSKGQHAAQGACSWEVLSYICMQNRGHPYAVIALLDQEKDTCTLHAS